MSLKNLVRKAKKSQVNTSQATVETDKPAFASLEYNLPFITPPDADILTLLEGFADTIKQNGNQLKEADKKAFILAFYRLAFSQEARAKGCFHPSEISTETNLCHRKLYFQKGEVKKDATYVNFTSDNRMMRLVDLGTMVHLYMQENLARGGVLIDYEVDVDAPEYGIKGKMDGKVEFVGTDDYGVYYDPEIMALEVKTINDYGFRALRKPKPEHIKQASIYGYFLGLKRIVFVYYNKNNSDLKIFVEDVDIDYVEGFKVLASSIIKSFNKNMRLHRTSDVAKHKDIPKKVCRSRTSTRAMECPFADYCFKHQSD